MRFKFRKKGLPKRLNRIPGGVPGLKVACNIHFHGADYPCAKVAFFESRDAMDSFFQNILPPYVDQESCPPIGRTTAGIVTKLSAEVTKFLTDGREEHRIEADKRFFCLVGLIIGKLTPEILAHEAVHVGFAWDYRTQGEGVYCDPDNREENICYPAGIFFSEITKFIEAEGLA